MNMRIATDQKLSSVKYLKRLIFQERNAKLSATLLFLLVDKNVKYVIFQKHNRSSNLRKILPKRQNSQSEAAAVRHQNANCYVTYNLRETFRTAAIRNGISDSSTFFLRA